MTTATKPPLVTRGQKTAEQEQKEKFFIEEPSEEKPSGITLRLDWNQATFRPLVGPQEDWETNAIDEAHPELSQENWEMLERRRSEIHDQRRQALLVEREKKLRGEVVLAMSLAMGVSPKVTEVVKGEESLGDWIELPRGNNGYGKALLGPFGARVDYAPLGFSDRYDFNVTLPGQACGAVGYERMVKLLQYQCRVGAVFTRLDIVMDDYDKVKTPAQIEKFMQGPQVVTRTEQYMKVHTGSVGDKAITGATLYVGAPSSRVRMRVYDKGLESEGLTDTIRWELQCRKESAETLGPLLAEGDWNDVIRQRFVSFIDFRKKDKAEVEDRTRLKWYSRLVDSASRANMYAAKALKTLEDKAAWIQETVAPTLAAVFVGTGRNMAEIGNLIMAGMSRWKPAQKEAVRVWQAGSKNISFGTFNLVDRAAEKRLAYAAIGGITN